MRILLDTQALLWLDSEPDRLSAAARVVIADPGNIVAVSVASVWEIRIKVAIGRLELDKDISEIVREQQAVNLLEILPIELRHADMLPRLPPIHKDPFDRIIVATAMADGYTLATADRTILQYPVETLSI